MTSITRMSIIPSVIVCAALAPTSRALAQEPAKEKPPVRTVMKTSGSAHGFSIVLVLGDLQGGPASDNVPPAARKALADMKDFLPYKSYRLLDTAWVLGATRVTSRLRGPEDQDYELEGAAIPEIARMLRIAPVTVRWHLSAGRRDLARAIRRDGPPNRSEHSVRVHGDRS